MKEQFTIEELVMVEKALRLVSIKAELNLIEELGDFSKNTTALKVANSAIKKMRKM